MGGIEHASLRSHPGPHPAGEEAVSRQRQHKRLIQQLARTPDRLLDFPRIGEKLKAYEPREVRRIFAANYERRYEISNGAICILRLWRCRENRSLDLDE